MTAIPDPNPRADDRDACRRKRRYADRDDAARVAERRMADGSERLKTYRCAHCDGWHLTKWI